MILIRIESVNQLLKINENDVLLRNKYRHSPNHRKMGIHQETMPSSICELSPHVRVRHRILVYDNKAEGESCKNIFWLNFCCFKHIFEMIVKHLLFPLF